MERFDYCEALENCDAEFQKRKRRIIEVEDSIEGLKITVNEIEKENMQYQKHRKLQEADQQICQSDFDAAIAKKFKISAEIEQCENDVASLTQQIAHIKTQMDEAKTFMQFQLNNSKKCGDNFAAQYLKYPWISSFENAKKQHENTTRLILENQNKISSLETELSTICLQNAEKFQSFVGSCVDTALLMSNINSTTEKLKENSDLVTMSEIGIFRKRGAFNSENKSLSQSIISQRISPTQSTMYKSLPLRERQLSSLPTLPLTKFSSTSRLRAINGRSLAENMTFLKKRN